MFQVVCYHTHSMMWLSLVFVSGSLRMGHCPHKASRRTTPKLYTSTFFVKCNLDAYLRHKKLLKINIMDYDQSMTKRLGY